MTSDPSLWSIGRTRLTVGFHHVTFGRERATGMGRSDIIACGAPWVRRCLNGKSPHLLVPKEVLSFYACSPTATSGLPARSCAFY